MRVIVTGGAGFIGSAVCRLLIDETDAHVLNVDKLTYASDKRALTSIDSNARYRFSQTDICDAAALAGLFDSFRPTVVMNLAAETHVDRSIDGADAFIQSNIIGTYTLLETARRYWTGLSESDCDEFRFLHVSTDEVYGSLGETGRFSETTAYDPSSPYAASKASADHLALAWRRTYGLPVLVSNCSNNYGPYQFPEKLIPLMILNALERRALPVYGDGSNVRDWLFVEDHARALLTIAQNGRIGEKYNVGGDAERRNIDVVETICDLVDKHAPDGEPRRALIEFVADRPGHDHRYAIDASKVKFELGWSPRESFESGLEKTVDWYLQNRDWWEPLRASVYGGERLGLAPATKDA